MQNRQKISAMLISIFISLIITASALGATANYYNEGHSGDSVEDAYIIDSVEDMISIQSNGDAYVRKYYKLSADLELPEHGHTIGLTVTFRGYFDGQGHTLKINRWLFYDVSAPSSKDIAIKNLKIEGIIRDDLSGIVKNLGSGIMENCTFSGDIEVEDSSAAPIAGGIAQRVGSDGIIKSCTFNGKITAKTSSSSGATAGGIAGELNGGKIENCKTTLGSEVSATSPVSQSYIVAAGGIVGSMTGGYVIDCDSNASVSGATNNGGIIGYLRYSSLRSNVISNHFTGTELEIGNEEGNNSKAYYEDHTGDSWEDAYIIASLEDLVAMQSYSKNYYPDKYYKLVADIEITSTTEWKGISQFAGYFDGQGHTIKINSSQTTLFKGLRGSISNLNVEGQVAYGGIADIFGSGTNTEHASITDCSFSGTVETVKTGTSEDLYYTGVRHFAGGIVGNLQAGVIQRCTFSGTVRVVNADDEDRACAGGIVGNLLSTGMLGTPTIENCTVSPSTIISARTVGGIVGLNSLPGGNMQLSGNAWPNQYPEVGTYGSGNTVPSPTNPISQDTYTKLEIAVISPIVLSDEIIAKLAHNISVDPSELILLTSADFDPSEPPEPTNAMRQKVQGQFMAKLNTINVNKDGWYVFMVTVSDDLVGTKVGDLRLYGAEASDFTASSFNAAFSLMPIVNGITGGLEISNFFGVKLDTLPKQFLATMFLSASQSLTVYIVKILLLLLGGCNAGFGVLGGGLMMLVSGILAIRFIKRKRR